MNPETKEKLTTQATIAKNKAFAAAAWCKEKIAATWKSGRKGKAICIGGAAVFLLLLMQCGGGESGGTFNGKNFSSVFMGNNTKDEGEIYQFKTDVSIKVLQSTKKGNLVGYVTGANPFAGGFESMVETFGGSFDRIVWVVTPGKMYEDGEKLGAGYYIRRGSYEYEGVDGGEHTVARYVEVTDKGVLKKIEKMKQKLDAKRQAEEKAREAKEKAEKEAKEAQNKAEEQARKKAAIASAERGAYELDIPVKALCGFKLGTPPSQIQGLLRSQFDAEKPVEDLVDDMNSFRLDSYHGQRLYHMAKPFRLFTLVEVTFQDKGAGKHLSQVELLAKVDENVEHESYVAELKALLAMIEKKFGIKFVKEECQPYQWRHGKESISIALTPKGGGELAHGEYLSLKFEAAGEIDRLDTAATSVPKASLHISSDAGADQL